MGGFVQCPSRLWFVVLIVLSWLLIVLLSLLLILTPLWLLLLLLLLLGRCRYRCRVYQSCCPTDDAVAFGEFSESGGCCCPLHRQLLLLAADAVVYCCIGFSSIRQRSRHR